MDCSLIMKVGDIHEEIEVDATSETILLGGEVALLEFEESVLEWIMSKDWGSIRLVSADWSVENAFGEVMSGSVTAEIERSPSL